MRTINRALKIPDLAGPDRCNMALLVRVSPWMCANRKGMESVQVLHALDSKLIRRGVCGDLCPYGSIVIASSTLSNLIVS